VDSWVQNSGLDSARAIKQCILYELGISWVHSRIGLDWIKPVW